MSSFLMVLVMKNFFMPYGISSHLFWPFEVWLILNFHQNLMYWLSKHLVNHVRSHRPRLPNKIPSGSVIIVSFWPKISPVLRGNLGLSFPLLLVFLNLLIFVNTIHMPTHTLYQLLGQGLSQIRSTLKVLITTSLKSLSISLNIS